MELAAESCLAKPHSSIIIVLDLLGEMQLVIDSFAHRNS